MASDDLRRIEAFADLSDEVLQTLRGVLDELVYVDGQQIFAEGDEGNAVYFIRDGYIRIEKRITAGGETTKTLAILDPGEFFGEMSLFDGKPRSASAKAKGPVKVYRVTRGTFDRLLHEDYRSATALLFAVIKTCHRRIRTLSSQVIGFHEIGKTIGEAKTLQELTGTVLAQLKECTGATTGFLAIKLEFFNRFEIIGSLGPSLPAETRELTEKLESLVGSLFKSGQGCLFSDLENDRTEWATIGMKGRSLLAQPILVESKPLGILVLGHSAPEQFSQNELEFCSSVARQVAQAILNFRFREEDQMRSKLGRQYVRF
jgi:CRP-like cAMP-binding protein